MKYESRLITPSNVDRNWIHYTKGGFNKCILINGNSCLPNCVGYCWGRWYELLGKEHNLAKTNAETWFLNTKDGYSRGQIPKLGAVACWSLGSTSTGNDGAGHVAIVEKVNADGSILISESNYGGCRFRYLTIPNGYNYPGTKLKFQGFIYIPIEWDNEMVLSDYTIGRIYTLHAGLNVRTGPSTKYKKKTKAELSPNAQKNAYDNGTLKQGTKVSCLECKKDDEGNTWIRIPSGWICGILKGTKLVK